MSASGTFVPQKAPKETIRLLSEIRAPLRTLLQTRTARGHQAATDLSTWTKSNGGDFFEFRLIREKGLSDPPLNWALSENAQTNLQCQMALEDNRNVLIRLLHALNHADPSAFADSLEMACKEPTGAKQ